LINASCLPIRAIDVDTSIKRRETLALYTSYLMVSSVVGFYSSPLFTSLLPRAQDTNLTQVNHNMHDSGPEKAQ
jgi:hypothetical protein